MRFIYSPDHLRFLQAGFRRMPVPELTAAFNAQFGTDRSEGAIKSTLSNHGFKCGRACGSPKGTVRVFTPDQVEFIKAKYKRMSRGELAAAFNAAFKTKTTAAQIVTFTKNHGISSGRTGQFKPGQKPWNTGTHYVAGGRSAETRFKPGQKPKTWVPIGTEVRDRDGYLKRKIKDDAEPGMSRLNWKFVHVLMWEGEHGPVPGGHAVLFRNGDKTDIRLENLVLVTRQELLWLNRNGLAHLPAEIHPAALSLAKLEVGRFEIQKERKKCANG